MWEYLKSVYTELLTKSVDKVNYEKAMRISNILAPK